MASENTEQNPYTRPGFVTAAVVVAVVLVLAVVLAYRTVTADGEPAPTAGPAETTAAPPTSTPAPSQTPEPGGEASVCGLEAVELDGTLTAAPQVQWELVGTTAAPGSTQHGPGVVEADGFRYCYSHTPTGALLAAANVIAMGSVPGLTEQINEQLVAEGPGRDAVLEQTPAQSAGGVRVQIAGFRLLDYTGNTAAVDIAIRGSNGALGGQVYDLAWESGDWKVELTDSGELPTRLVELPNLAGYILWAGA